MSRENELILVSGVEKQRPFFPCEPIFIPYVVSFSDGPQFHASIPTQSSFGHQKKPARYKPDRRLGTGKLPHVRFSGNRIHRSDCVSKPIDYQTENRLQSICQRIPRLLQIKRLRFRFRSISGYARGHDGPAFRFHGLRTRPTARTSAPSIGPFDGSFISQKLTTVRRS